MKIKSKLIGFFIGVVLITTTCISAMAFSMKTDNGHGYVTFGTSGDPWVFSYCYYDHDQYNHYAIAYLNERTNGRANASPGETACSHSPTIYKGSRDKRDWGTY